jgi:hypothetical protein
MKRLVVLVAAVPLILGAACSVSPGDKVSVRLDEWSIKVTPATARSGRVRFQIDSVGKERHDLALIQAARVEDLPRTPEGKLDLAANRPIDEIEAFEPGHYIATSPNLLAGKYLVVCTLEDHVARGMWAKFTVVARKKAN